MMADLGSPGSAGAAVAAGTGVAAGAVVATAALVAAGAVVAAGGAAVGEAELPPQAVSSRDNRNNEINKRFISMDLLAETYKMRAYAHLTTKQQDMAGLCTHALVKR